MLLAPGKKTLILVAIGLLLGSCAPAQPTRPAAASLPTETVSSAPAQIPSPTNSPTAPAPTETALPPTPVSTPIGGSGEIAVCAAGKLSRITLAGETSLLSENCSDASLSPDGSRLVSHEGSTLLVQNINTNETSRTDMYAADTPFEGDPFPRFVWSPDSRRVAFVYRSGVSSLGLFMTNPEFNEAVPISRAILGISEIAWSADGQWLAFSSTDAALEALIYVFNIAESEPMPLNPFPGKRDQIMGLSLSPDGSKLLFTNSGAYRNSVPALYMVDIDGSHLTDLAHHASIGESAWSVDGNKIAFCQGEYPPDIHEVVMNVDGTDRIDFHEKTFSHCQAVFASSGEYVLFFQEEKTDSGYSDSLYSVNLESQERVKLFSDWLSMSLSPDGQQIAFVLAEDKRLTLIHPDGSGLTPVTPLELADGTTWLQWLDPGSE